MEFFQKNKKIILFLGILAAVIAVYELFFAGGSSSGAGSATDPTAGGLVSELSVSPSDAIVGRELLTMLYRLKSIKIDTTVFSDHTFTSLQDWSRPIDPQPFGKPLGRRNPFSDFETGTTGNTSQGASAALPSSAFGAGTKTK